MGAIPNCFLLLLVGAGVLVARAQANAASSGSHTRAVRLLGALGILAFTFSIITPDDDLLQQEVGGPSPQYASMVRTLRPVLRGSTSTLSAAVPGTPAHPLLPPRTVGIQVSRKRCHVTTRLVTPACIHSPPV
jgi:hypothetical protein